MDVEKDAELDICSLLGFKRLPCQFEILKGFEGWKALVCAWRNTKPLISKHRIRKRFIYSPLEICIQSLRQNMSGFPV